MAGPPRKLAALAFLPVIMLGLKKLYKSWRGFCFLVWRFTDFNLSRMGALGLGLRYILPYKGTLLYVDGYAGSV